MERLFCRFPARIVKAYIDPKTQKKRIEAIASDNALDWYRERFSEEALDDMVEASKKKNPNKPEQGLVKFQETHWETFSIGYIVDGERIKNEKLDTEEYKAVIELKEGVWQADELYDDVIKGRADKQLSVGGWLKSSDDYAYETTTFVNEDSGEEVEVRTGLLKSFDLEHIAATPPDEAANPRTGFTGESNKSKGFENGAIWKSIHNEKLQEKANKTNRVVHVKKNLTSDNESEKTFLKNITNLIKEGLEKIRQELKEGEGEDMNKLEKAQEMVFKLKEFVEKNSKDFDEEVMKELGVSFEVVSDEEEEDTTEGITEEIVKTMIDEMKESIKKDFPEIPEIPEIPKDNSEEVETLKTKIEELEKTLKEKLEEFEKKIKETKEELDVVAKASGISQSEGSEDEEDEEEEEEETTEEEDEEYAEDANWN